MKSGFWKLCLAFLVTLQVGVASHLRAQSTPDAGMLRYPDVSSEKIVFVYSGDLWTVPRDGGMASPLASPAGTELNPRFSPDGSQIAFVGSYDAGSDIYVIPTGGGMAERKTYHPARETLCEWTPDGGLLFSSNAFAGLGRQQQLLTIGEDHPTPKRLPVPYGSNGTISEDGTWLAYTPYSRDTRTWKRYRGGMASDIWLFNLKDQRSLKITDWEGTDSLPMWNGQSVYYLSDAGPNHRLNIWRYDTNTKAREQITTHANFDVKWPSIGPGANDEGEIVYQLGSDLRLLNLKTNKSKAVSVMIPGDRPRLRKQIVDASKYTQGGSISPTGKRVAVEARGDIWSAPAENGTPRNLTQTSGVAERYPAWSPDGRWIAYFSDATGEYELMVTQSDGLGETKRLTNDGAHWRYNPIWSPDSKMIAFTDKTGTILLHDIEAGKTKKIDKDPYGNPPNVTWSYDSGWIAYDKSEDSPNAKSAIWVYEVATEETKQLTSGYFNDSWPAFDRKGEFLYFQSNRRFSSPKYEDVGASFIYEDTAVLLALPLRADVKNPLLPKIDEVSWDEEKDDKESNKEESSDEGDEESSNEDKPKASAGNPSGDIVGSWEISIDTQMIPPEGRESTMVITRNASGDLSGVVKTAGGELELTDISFDTSSREFSAKVESPMGSASLKGTVSGNSMTGKVSIEAVGLVADFSATRASQESPEDDSDEAKDEQDSDKGSNKKEAKKEPLKIDWEDIERRVIPLPVAPGGFNQLVCNHKDQLIYLRTGGGKPPAIKLFDLRASSPKEQDVASGGGFELSADGKKLLLVRGGFSITSAGPGNGSGKPVKTDGMQVMIEPRAEWEQVFTEAWRMERDFFYDPNLHGVDWMAVRKRYSRMLKDATSRSDVGFIIGEMISELNVGHAYYRGIQDDKNVPSSNMGFLGCDLEPENGRFKIARFSEGGPWDTDAQSPLRVAGAKVGQYVLSVEGRQLTTDENVFAAFQGLSGRLVTIVVSDDPKLDEEDQRLAMKLAGSESSLRFRAWIEEKRQRVDKMSDGKIGYIYVVNTGQPGQNDLFRQFYAQMGKEALIIDDRWNGGGQIPTRFIELLNRPATNFWARRDGRDWRWPRDSHQGPKCMLINGLAGSGGDMFPALFRQAGLGKLIGMRTWGGLVGITGGPSLIDGASVTAPSFAYYELDGTWGIEGHGVDPDIEVVDDPALMVDGGDPQLDTAIEHLLEEMKTNGFKAPERPTSPDRKKMGIPQEDY